MRACFSSLGLLLLVPVFIPEQAFAQRETVPVTREGQPEIFVDIGYATLPMWIKPGHWYPVWLTVRAGRLALTGSVTLLQRDNPLRVGIPVDVASGTTKRYLAYYRFGPRNPSASNTELGLAINVEHFPLREMAADLRFEEESAQHLLLIAEQPGAFRFLDREGVQVGPAFAQSPRYASRTIRAEVERLPGEATALAALDAIVISGAEARAITREQWEAIRAWVALGGRLLIAGGKYHSFLAQSNLAEPFGLRFGEPRPVPLENIAGVGAPGGELPEDLRGDIMLTPPLGDDFAIQLGDSALPLLVSRRVGRGWFHFSAAAFDPPLLRAINLRPDASAFWPRLLEQDWLRDSRKLGNPAMEAAILGALQEPFNYNLAGSGWVFGFLVCYTLVALPLNWWAWGKMKRRGWAWPSAVVLAVLFAVYGVRSGTQGQVAAAQLNELSWLTGAGDGETVSGITWSTLYSPRRMRTDIAPAATTFARPIDGDARQNFDLTFGPPMMLPDFYLPPWSARDLRGDFTLTVAGGVEGAGDGVPGAPDGLRHEYVNRTPWTFTRWAIVDGEQLWRGQEPLASGGRARLAPSRPTSVSYFISMIESGLQDAVTRESRPVDVRWADRLIKAERQTPLRFIGLIDSAVAPLFEHSVVGAQRTGMTIYEQAVAPPDSLGPLRWEANVVEGQSVSYPPPEGGDHARSRSAAWLQVARIELTPNWPLEASPGSTIRIGFNVNLEGSVNGRRQAYGAGRGNVEVELLDCPIRVFNRHRNDWENLSNQPNGSGVKQYFAISPLSHYADPVTGSISLNINGQPENCTYSISNLDGPPRKENINGRPLAERGLSVNGQMLADVRMQLSDLKIQIVGPESIAGEARND